MTTPVPNFVVRNAALLGRSATRVPVETSIATALAVAFSVGVTQDSSSYMEAWARWALAGLLAFPLVFSASLAHVRGRLGQGPRLAVSLVAAGAAAAWVHTSLIDQRPTAYAGYALLLVAAFAQMPLVAAMASRSSEGDQADAVGVGSADDPGHARRVWWFTAQFFERAIVLNVVLQFLFGGLAAAIAAVDTLFGLSLADDPYLHLASLVFIALYPVLVAAGIDDFIQPARGAAGLARPVRWFVGYVFVPLIVLYVGIVYAYHAKWLVTSETPINVISPLILAAGALGVFAAVFTESELRAGRGTGAIAVVRWWPALWLPLVPMAAWAIWARIAQYGFTEFRYVRLLGLAALVVVAADSLVRTVRRREPALASTLVIVAVVCVLGAVGPLSATAVSLRSQTDRLRAALERADAWVDGRVVLERVVADAAVASEVASLTTYLADYHGVRRALSALGLEADDEALAGNPERITSSWSLIVALGLSDALAYDAQSQVTVNVTATPGEPAWLPAGRLYRVTSASGAADPGLEVAAIQVPGTDRVALTTPGGDTFELSVRDWSAEALAGGELYADVILAPAEALVSLTAGAHLIVERAWFATDRETGIPTGSVEVHGWLIVPFGGSQPP